MNITRSFALLLTLTLGGACAGSVSIENRSCPCADGWTCCPGANVCVAPGTACPASPNGSASGTSVDLVTFDGTPAQPQCFGQDRDHLYWLDGEGHLTAIAKSGGAVVRSRFETPSQAMPWQHRCTIAIDGNDLYATMFGLGKVLRASIAKDGVWDLGYDGALIGELVTPTSLALDANAIYVTESDSHAIKRITRTTGDAGVTFDKGMTIETAGGGPRDLVADETSLYWLDDGGLRRMSKQGGSITTLKTTPGSYLTLVGGTLYWSSMKEGGLQSMPIGGGNPQVVTFQHEMESCSDGIVLGSSTASHIRAIAAAGNDVFLADNTRIHQSTSGTGSSVVLFQFRPICRDLDRDVRLLAVDGTHVFWADQKVLRSRAR